MIDTMTSVTVLSLCLAFLASSALAQSPCSNSQMACSRAINEASNSLSPIMQAQPPDNAAIATACGMFRTKKDQCVAGVRAQCTAGTTIDRFVTSLEQNFNSMCGPELTCALRLQGCSLDVNTTVTISRAAAMSPPDVTAVKAFCSKVMATSLPCLQQLRQDCSEVASLAPSIASASGSLESMCGKANLCNLEVGKCSASMANLPTSGQSQPGQDEWAQLCQAYVATKACLDTEVDADCRSMPAGQGIYASVSREINENIKQCGGAMGPGSAGGPGQGQGGMPTGGPCPGVMACVSKMQGAPDQCSESLVSMWDCISALRDECAVLEDSITFQRLKELGADVCQELSAAPKDYENCPSLKTCVMKSRFVQTMMSMGQGGMAALGNMQTFMIDSANWCQYLGIATSCIVKSADSCDLDADLIRAVSTKHQTLQKTCMATGPGSAGGQGQGQEMMPTGGPCPGVMACVSKMQGAPDQCSESLVSMWDCISALRDECDVLEDAITFQRLKELGADVCQELSAAPKDYENCPALKTCVMKSRFVQTMMSMGQGGMAALGNMQTFMIDSANWCQYLGTATSCVVKSADSCDLDADLIRAVSTKHQTLQKTCMATGAAGPSGTASSVTSLLLAALMCLTVGLLN